MTLNVLIFMINGDTFAEFSIQMNLIAAKVRRGRYLTGSRIHYGQETRGG